MCHFDERLLYTASASLVRKCQNGSSASQTDCQLKKKKNRNPGGLQSGKGFLKISKRAELLFCDVYNL